MDFHPVIPSSSQEACIDLLPCLELPLIRILNALHLVLCVTVFKLHAVSCMVFTSFVSCAFFLFFSFKVRSHSLLISFPPAFILFTFFLDSFCHIPFPSTGRTQAVLPQRKIRVLLDHSMVQIGMRHGHISEELARVQGMDICQALSQLWVNR